MFDEAEETARVESIPGRKEARYPARAQVRIADSELVLKDVSLSGGCIQSKELLDIAPNGNYTIMIIPEEESLVERFKVDVLSRWVRMKRTGTESGFIIVFPPGSGVIERYIEFLKSAPERDTTEP
jgi:hypothetical protein